MSFRVCLCSRVCVPPVGVASSGWPRVHLGDRVLAVNRTPPLTSQTRNSHPTVSGQEDRSGRDIWQEKRGRLGYI